MNRNLNIIGWSAFAVASLGSSMAYADSDKSANSGDLEEIIITAEHRAVDLQKSGLSVSVISAAELEKLGAADDAQVLQNVPGVVLQGVTDGPSAQSVQGGGGPPNIAIRGLGTPSPNTVGAVAVYEDGVLLMGGGANFYDMTRVEVLRGPQGTLYGRGATAGAVNYITNDPTQQFSASGRIQLGSYNLIATQGTLNLPLTDTLAVRAAFNQVRHNGFFNNGQSDEQDASARIKVLYQPNDNISLLAGYTDYKSDGSGPGQVLLEQTVGTATTVLNPKTWTTDLGGGSTDTISYRKADLTFNADFGPAKLTYIGAYQTTESRFAFNWHGFFGFSYLASTQPINETWTHELRLASTGDSALSWQGGVYYYKNKLQASFEPGMPPLTGAAYVPAFAFTQAFQPTSLGLFGEATWKLNDTTRLTGGVRETRDHMDETQTFQPGGTGGTPTDFVETTRHFDWKAKAEKDLTADNLVYGTISTGYRPGGFVNGIPSVNEKVTAYEVGSKNRLASALTLNGAVYYYHYSGFQNVATVPDPVTGNLVTVLVPLPAKFYGAEIELAAQLSSYDKLKLSPAFESAKYTASATGYATDGTTVPNAPKFTVSGGYEHVFPLPNSAQLAWSVDAHYQTSAVTDFDSRDYPTTYAPFEQKAYTIANSAFTYSTDKYSLSLYGKNLTNKLVKLTVYNPNPAAAYVNDPRTYGVMIAAHL